MTAFTGFTAEQAQAIWTATGQTEMKPVGGYDLYWEVGDGTYGQLGPAYSYVNDAFEAWCIQNNPTLEQATAQAVLCYLNAKTIIEQTIAGMPTQQLFASIGYLTLLLKDGAGPSTLALAASNVAGGRKWLGVQSTITMPMPAPPYGAGLTEAQVAAYVAQANA